MTSASTAWTKSPRSIWTTLRWPALAILPLLSAGVLKVLGFPGILGLDLTLLALVWLIGAAIVASTRYGLPLAELAWMLPFVLVVLLRVLAAADGLERAYAQEKFTELFFLTFVAAVASAVLVQRPAQLISFDFAWVALGLFVAFMSLSAWGTLGVSDTRLSIGTGGGAASGGVGYLSGASLIVVGVAWSRGRLRWKWALPLSVVLLTAVLGSNSRGAVLALAVTSLALLLLSTGTRLLVRYVAILGLVALLTLIVIPDNAFWRATLEDGSRSWLWSQAWSGFVEEPLWGHGFGSFALATSLEYPHNVLLEIAYELGILGLLAFALILGRALRNVVRFRTHPAAVAAGGLVVFWWVGALVSLDLRNRNLWICLVVSLMIERACAGLEARGSTSPRAVSTPMPGDRSQPRPTRSQQMSTETWAATYAGPPARDSEGAHK